MKLLKISINFIKRDKMSNIEKINSEIKDYVNYVQKGGKLEPFLGELIT